MRTIARNHTRKIAAVRATIVKVVADDRNDGPVAVTVDAALDAQQGYDDARLIDNEDGTYTVNVHGIRWYDLYTQAALDRIAAEQARRDAANATRREIATHVQRRSGTTPAQDRARRQADTLARTTSIHDLGKTASAATVTRTRPAVNTQVKEACAALGIQADYFVSAKSAGYAVPGHGDFTLGELADLVLEGGFTAAFDANETRPVAVNPFVDRAPIAAELPDEDPARTTVAEIAVHALLTDDHAALDAAMVAVDNATTNAGGWYLIPAHGDRLNDRHDVLGPYNGRDMAEHLRTTYADAGITGVVVHSETRPVPVAQADASAAPVCQCAGVVACEWIVRDGKQVSMCLRCGADR